MSTPVNASTMPRGAGFTRPAPASSSARPAPAEPTAPDSSGSSSRSGFTSLLAAEAIKLRRSSAWVVAVLLPLLAVITGTVNFIMNRESFEGWISLSSQITLFYSMMFCSLGIALLASTVWRVEHRGTSWQSLLSMLMRSFAAPVAVAFLGCVVGFGLLASQNPLIYLVPQGILSETLTLGSSAVSTAGKLDAASMLPLVFAIVCIGAVMWGLLALVARRTGGVR